ncbi:CPBP family intramembrane metalloprotease [Psychroserpens burtonensis]|uniref:CPBP family intramembrane metalloprotease n=1 Tax=Psychroserpens burtonensis TaxID=49278 RepID=A0A5C7B9R2_9FLAO|nr:type II CAAX endopeptidase family protein [Psychroserpens burtonensis]TXE15326.1 CPBP family intramembrane metalloprotease [Psychroserpens burtonensis]
MIWTTILAVLIGIIYPIYFLLTYKKTNNSIKQDDKIRLIDYKQTITIFWGLTILILINFYTTQLPQLNLYPNFTIISIVFSVLALAFMIVQYKQSNITSASLAIVKAKMKETYRYLPKTKKEFYWFIMLSISAGICEEIIFRLFLFEFLKENANLLIAFILTNIIFSITHIGMGKQNMIASFILGFLFSAIYYFTENIWIAVLLHIAIDINSGILGYRMNNLEQKIMENPNG